MAEQSTSQSFERAERAAEIGHARNAASAASAASAAPAAPASAIATAPAAATPLPDKLTYYRLFWIFIICSVIGLVAETIISYPIDGIWKDRAGLVWGPFSPIYGAGGALVTLALWNLRDSRALAQFTAAAFVGAGFEFIAGWFWKNFFGIVAWDYSSQPFNLHGYTCLGMAIVWGFAGLAWMRIGLPVLLRAVDAVPTAVRKPLTVVATAYMVANIAMTLLAFNAWFERQDGNPVDTPIEQYFAADYGDDFMSDRFQTMSIYAHEAQHRD